MYGFVGVVAPVLDYLMNVNLSEKGLPLIRMSMSSITNETDGFWGTCFTRAAEGIDPIKQHFRHKILLEGTIKEEKASGIAVAYVAFKVHSINTFGVLDRSLIACLTRSCVLESSVLKCARENRKHTHR